MAAIRMRTTVPEHFDVLIVGAGLSGIGAACHLRRRCPDKTFAILEARDSIGGTWDLFRYPGIRSDSDMHTMGYSFRPWEAPKAIADGPSILSYIKETADEYGVTDKVRVGHRVISAEWSSANVCWNVVAERTDTGETVELSAGFLFFCSGYYRYDQAYAPELPGAASFQGQIIHPQSWPEDLDYAGQAGGGDRQRRDGRDDRADDGRHRGARDHAPALAELRDRAARA